MKIVSVHAAKPKTFTMENGEEFQTSIFKEKMEGRVWARGNAIDGDESADKEWHGGETKAVYSYACEHYPYWMKELEKTDLPFGMFGENLTTEGLDESSVCLGDRFRMGEALLEALTPRIPCEMLGFRFKDQTIVKRFLQSGRSGIYYRIVEEGQLAAGDTISLEKNRGDTVKISEMAAVYADPHADKKRVREISELPDLPADYRVYLQKRLGE